jgi:hypothetical protein
MDDWGNIQSEDNRASTHHSKKKSDSDEPQEIVLATGWVTDANGKVIALVADAPSYNPDVPWLRHPSCHGQQ